MSVSVGQPGDAAVESQHTHTHRPTAWCSCIPGPAEEVGPHPREPTSLSMGDGGGLKDTVTRSVTLYRLLAVCLCLCVCRRGRSVCSQEMSH